LGPVRRGWFRFLLGTQETRNRTEDRRRQKKTETAPDSFAVWFSSIRPCQGTRCRHQPLHLELWKSPSLHKRHQTAKLSGAVSVFFCLLSDSWFPGFLVETRTTRDELAPARRQLPSSFGEQWPRIGPDHEPPQCSPGETRLRLQRTSNDHAPGTTGRSEEAERLFPG
jgi:hypothetical protein